MTQSLSSMKYTDYYCNTVVIKLLKVSFFYLKQLVVNLRHGLSMAHGRLGSILQLLG